MAHRTYSVAAPSSQAIIQYTPEGPRRRAARNPRIKSGGKADDRAASSIPGKRYEISATFLRREFAPDRPTKPGVWEVGAGRNWRGQIVSVIDHPRFTRVWGMPQFHEDGRLVKRGDVVRLLGVARETGELDCRAIALAPLTMIAEVVKRERAMLRGDVAVVRGGKFPFVILEHECPLMPGDVARFVGVRLGGGRLRGIDEKLYLDCAVDGATVEVLPPTAKPALNVDNFAAEIAAFRWSRAVYDYHIVKLYALYGRNYVAEIAASPDKLDHPDLWRWWPHTKERILRAAQEVVRTNAARVSTWVRDHWPTRGRK